MGLTQTLRLTIRSVEDWWFDITRHVRTAENASSPGPADIVGELRDSQIYAPVRAANAYAALRDLPIQDLSSYTFIDMGSGKGRMLFIAAEYPFRKVLGVEFSTALHQQAQSNIASYRYRKQQCTDIESIHADAASFAFPAGNLVIYMFNPFGPDIMQRMVANLQQALDRSPRQVVVVLLWPENSKLIAAMPSMREFRKTRRYHIYQAA